MEFFLPFDGWLTFDGLQYTSLFDVTRVRPVTRFSNGAYDFDFGLKNCSVQHDVQYAIRNCFFLGDLPMFSCVPRGAHRTLTGVQPLVPRYWPGYYRYHGTRTTLGQYCTADCHLALRDVYVSKATGTFVVVESDSSDLAFLWSCCCCCCCC